MRNFIKQPNFARFFSSLREIPDLKLVKFNQRSKGDYELFRGLIIDNMNFSALQFLIPNIRDDIPDLTDSEELRRYFDNINKDKYLRDAYNFVTQNHEKGALGYCKIMQDDEFIGNTGWIMHDIDEKGIIHKLERGIHLKQELCSLDGKPNTCFKPKTGALAMKQVIQQFEDNIESLDEDGQIFSSILKTNKRSQEFTKKYRLNVGDPVFEENGTLKWVQRIGDFASRTGEIKELLDEAINEGR